MVHLYRNNGCNIALDVNSGAVHVVDDLAYEAIALFEAYSREEILGKLRDRYEEQEIREVLEDIEELKKQGLSETEIAKSMGLTTTQYRTQKSLAKDERRALEVATAKGLREKGYSLNEIAEKMGYTNDSSIRSLLNENSEARMNQAKKTAEFLKKQIEEKAKYP